MSALRSAQSDRLPAHAACTLFPEMSPEEFAELCRDVAAHGLREPIVTHRGQILDGRNRLRACEAVGCPPRFREWEGDEGDILDYVVGLNLHRRHLNQSQRAMVADKIATMRQGERTDREPSANLQKVARDEAARQVGVSTRSVAAARVVRSKGTPKLAEAVEKGEVSVAAAEQVATLPMPVQEAVVAAGPMAVQAKAAEVRRGRTRVNGVEGDDPADVAKLRAAGRIAPGVVVEVTEGDAGADDVCDVAHPASAGEDALGDEDWLATLPARGELDGARRSAFDEDALLYRRLEAARKTFAHHASRAIAKCRRKGAYLWIVRGFLKRDHPRHWQPCPAPEFGGCAGGKVVEMLGQCPQCRGRGYWIK